MLNLHRGMYIKISRLFLLKYLPYPKEKKKTSFGKFEWSECVTVGRSARNKKTKVAEKAR